MIDVYAHRGHLSKYPENTEPAFREAIALGVHGIELDVRLTSDGQLVVIHDSKVDRVSNGTGLVESLSFENLKDLDAGSWFDSEFAGLNFLSLEEALAIVGDQVELNLHLKTTEANNDKIVGSVINCVREKDLFNTTFISSGRPAIEYARKAEPRIRGCYLGPRPRNTLQCIQDSLELNCQILQVPREDLNPDFTKLAQENGLHINALHVTSKNPQPPMKDVHQQLTQLGIDGVVTDFIEFWLQDQE